MSVKIMSWVWEQDIPTTKKMLLLAIADHSDDDGDNSWPSKHLLAKKVNVTEGQIRRLLRELETDGWIHTSLRSGGSNRVSPDRRPNLYQILLTRGRMDAPSGNSVVMRSDERGRTGAPYGGAGVHERGRTDAPQTISESSEPSLATDEHTTHVGSEPRVQKKDRLYHVVCDACLINKNTLTESAKAPIKKAVKELRYINATEDEVISAARKFRECFPNAMLTPSALAKHFPTLVTRSVPDLPGAATDLPQRRSTVNLARENPCGPCSGSGYIDDPDEPRTAMKCIDCSGTGIAQ